MTQTVWVTRYSDVNFAAFEGVYFTKEKALEAVWADAKRYEWMDMTRISHSIYGDDWEIYTFRYKELNNEFSSYVGVVTISRTEIQ